MYFNEKIVLITGASSGIGEALAYSFAKQNATILLCARNQKELERVRQNIKSPCEIFVCDITDYSKVDMIVATIIAKYKKVDTIIHSAGVSQRGLAKDTAFSVDEQIMKLNYFAAVYLTKKLLPLMIAQKSGNLIVISSITGKYGFWERSAYAASKHALHGFFETLQIELKEFNINTLLVCAGGVKTNISNNAITADGTPHGQMDDLQKRGSSPEYLAERTIKAAEKGKKLLFIGKGEVYLYFIKKWFPWLFFKILESVKGR